MIDAVEILAIKDGELDPEMVAHAPCHLFLPWFGRGLIVVA